MLDVPEYHVASAQFGGGSQTVREGKVSRKHLTMTFYFWAPLLGYWDNAVYIGNLNCLFF